MAETPTPYRSARLARQARERFVSSLCDGLPAMGKALSIALDAQIRDVATHQVMQKRRDTWLHFRTLHQQWLGSLGQAWRESGAAPLGEAELLKNPVGDELGELELVSEEVVENRLVGARLARAVAANAENLLEAIRQRTKHLQGSELAGTDVLRPEIACLAVVDQWLASGLSRDELELMFDSLQDAVVQVVVPAYESVAHLYDEQGVPDAAALRTHAVRMAGAATRSPAGLAPAAAGPASGAGNLPVPGGLASAPYGMAAPAGMAAAGGVPYGVGPLEEARQRAQEVMFQLQHLLVQSSTGFSPMQAPPATMALTQALSSLQVQANAFYGSGMPPMVVGYAPQAIAHAVTEVRQRAVELKGKAESASEKAIIEIVALMFQSILDEDRIPPSVRVWFARLQVPVLRVALGEPEFFNNADHPARRLIDRMGSCVLGFDANAISDSALEKEIRRVVQVVEQYPETGSKVFQIVFDEFEKFLAGSLAKTQKTASEIVGVAQQMEQKETLTVQFTIELRTMLRDMPVRDEIRDFLFKTWAEVLAMSAVKFGQQDKETVAYKRIAADLVWASGAKPNRTERTQVIKALPAILERWRRGLVLIGVDGERQDTEVKVITDTLADAFVSKTAMISQARVDEMAERLANLEEFISDESMGDIPLSAENIEMLLGIDASAIEVIADTGAPVQTEALKRAHELPLGTWYTLDHNRGATRVQYVWHSERKQLHLFVAPNGQNYLFQVRRLAAYLQARLLAMEDVEGITVRATRNVLTKLHANPERLLH